MNHIQSQINPNYVRLLRLSGQHSEITTSTFSRQVLEIPELGAESIPELGAESVLFGKRT